MVDDEAGSVTIRSLDEAVAAAQVIMAGIAPPERLLADELVVEGSAEATRE